MIISAKNVLGSPAELTGLEKEILHYVQKGLSSEEMALLFNCKREMIGVHRRRILQKTGCTSMFDVLSLAMKKGWV